MRVFGFVLNVKEAKRDKDKALSKRVCTAPLYISTPVSGSGQSAPVAGCALYHCLGWQAHLPDQTSKQLLP